MGSKNLSSKIGDGKLGWSGFSHDSCAPQTLPFDISIGWVTIDRHASHQIATDAHRSEERKSENEVFKSGSNMSVDIIVVCIE